MRIERRSTLCRRQTIQNGFGLLLHRTHIVFKLRDGAGENTRFCFPYICKRTVAKLREDEVKKRLENRVSEIFDKSPAEIEINFAAIVDDRRVVGEVFENGRAVLILDVRKICKRPFGAIGNGDRHRPERRRIRPRRKIIEIILSVISANAVGREEIDELALSAPRVLALSVGDAVTSPIRQIGHGRAPHGVVARAESRTALLIVSAVEIHPIAKDVRFAVGHIFV